MMKITLTTVFLFFSFSVFAETSREVFGPGEKPPISDQPWKTNNSVAASSEEEPLRPPPYKGVIHLPRESAEEVANYLACVARLKTDNYATSVADHICNQQFSRPVVYSEIDPEREYPILGGQRPGVLTMDTEIDPEREYPILGGRQSGVVSMDPEREYPILGGRGILNSDVGRWTETPIPGAIEVPKFQATDPETMISVFEGSGDNLIVTSVPLTLVLGALELINSVEITAEMEENVLRITYATAAGTGLYMLTRGVAVAGRLSPLGALLAVITPTAASAATMDDMYNTPEGFAYFLTLSPEDQAREVSFSPTLAARVLALAQAIGEESAE